MTFFFQNPALLGLLALGALPLLVHLLSRARPPEVRFSNIEFLRRVVRRTARIRRPREWLLLALRTLALLALAAAFAAPFLISKSAALPGEKSTIVLLIDRSASMAARHGAGSRFEIATAQAARFLDESRPSAANIVWIDAGPTAAFPEPGPNLAFLTDSLKQAAPRPEPGALAAAFDLALRQLAQVQGHRELVVFSDFQASAWKDFAPALPAGLEIRAFQTAAAPPPNLAVSRLLTQPPQPVAGQETTVLASVKNFSADPVRSQLTLDAGGSRQSRAIEIPAWGETETAFTLRPASAGPVPVTASVEADTFPGDDARHAVLRVRDAIRIDDSQAPNAVLEKVVAALPWLEKSTAAAAGDIRAISSWTDAADLRKAAANGVTILIHSATSAPAGLLETTAEIPSETSGAGWQMLPDESHPAVRLFRAGDFGNPFAGKFHQRLHFPALAGARAIANYTDGVPAIFEIPTAGAPILFFNLTLDPAKSDWIVQNNFLPAFAEILLRTRSNAAAGPETQPGSFLVKTSADPALAGAIRLIGPDGNPRETDQSVTAAGMRWQSREPAAPGIYRWEVSGQTVDLAAVNFPDSESDLRPLPAAPAFGERATDAASPATAAAFSRGIELWPWLALAAVLFLLAESLLVLRSTRPATSAGVRPTNG